MKRAAIIALALATAFPAVAGASWDWQLSPPFDLERQVDVMGIDPDAVPVGDIDALNARGVYTICYVSVGTLEDWRTDIAAFPAGVVGHVYGDWPDEKFLDIRALDVLLPLMQARFQRCADLGFDAVEPDNMDVHSNASGFAISAADSLRYVRALAGIAHGIGLEIGQKNVPDLTDALINDMDFAIIESCWQDHWCGRMTAYVSAGKPVYDAEYTDRSINFKTACAWAQDAGFSMILKDRDLTRHRKACQT